MYMYVNGSLVESSCCVYEKAWSFAGMWHVDDNLLCASCGGERKKEGECEEGFERKEEDMSIGESTKHVPVTCMTFACALCKTTYPATELV